MTEEELQKRLEIEPPVESLSCEYGVLYPSGEIRWTMASFISGTIRTAEGRASFVSQHERVLAEEGVVGSPPLVFVRRARTTTSTPVEIVID